MRISSVMLLPLALFLAPPVHPEQADWLPTLAKGKEAARTSGQAILYITSWPPGV